MKKSSIGYIAVIWPILFAVSILSSSDVLAQACLNPTHTPSSPISDANLTGDVLCDVGDQNACRGGTCSPDYVYVEWEIFRCLGGLLNGRTWSDGDHGWAAACVGLGGIPVPEHHSCNSYSQAHCSVIRCGKPGDCPSDEFCSGDGICKTVDFCTSSAECGEYVCRGGLCVALPDLIISSFLVEPSVINAGEQFLVLAEVKNVGVVPTSNFAVSLWIGGETNPQVTVVNGLAPDASQLIWRTMTLNVRQNYLTRIQVDSQNQIDEAIETNNGMRIPFVVE